VAKVVDIRLDVNLEETFKLKKNLCKNPQVQLSSMGEEVQKNHFLNQCLAPAGRGC
jgi:hypothetical protein